MSDKKITDNNKISDIDNMWWKLPLVKNTTNMTKGKWIDKQSKDITGNHAVLTGKVNNITGIDLDFGYKLSDDELQKNNITKKFIELFGREPEWNTYTVRTRSGGLHYYFEYDEDIKQTQDSDCYIDIRGNGGCLYGAGTIVTKGKKQGKYICINNVTPIKMPDELKEFLLENLYTKKDPIQTESNKKNKIKKANNRKHRYSFSDDELRCIFDGLPKEYWTTYSSQNGKPSFLGWTTACHSIGCPHIWDEYNQKYPGYNKHKNVSIWNSTNIDYDFVTNLLKNTSYPNALKMIDYHKYQPILDNEIEADVVIDSEKLGYDYLEQDINYIIKSDTGTGKTTTFDHYIQNTNEKFISITSRVSLANEQYKRFSQNIDGVMYYKNITKDNRKNILPTHKNKYYEYYFKQSLVIEIESLITRIPDLQSITNISDMVVYLDEFNSLIQHIHTSSTLEHHLTFVLDNFIYLLKNCKQIICTDADISDTSILWFKNNIGRDFEYHINEYQHNKNVKAHEVLSYEDLLDKLHKNKKWLVPCDSRQNALTLHEQFPDAKLVVAETTDIPELDDHDRVIFSPKILYGVDSVMERPVFCFFEERTIDPEKMVQMTCRCRNITNLYYLFLRKRFKAKNVDEEEVWDTIMKKHEISIRYFKNRHFQHLERGYLETLHRIEYDKKCYQSNPYAHFKRLIRERGIEDVNMYKCTKSASFQVAKKDKRTQMEYNLLNEFTFWSNGDISHEKFDKIQKILKVPKNELLKYEKYFIDDKMLYRHWNIATAFFQKNIQEKFENFDEKIENFTINKITKNKAKMKILQDIKIACDCQDIYDIEPKKIMDDKLFQDYKIAFNIRAKNAKANTIHDCQKIIVTIYKHLFGKYIIDGDDKVKQKGSKKQYSFNEYSIQKDKLLFDFRNEQQVENKFIDE